MPAVLRDEIGDEISRHQQGLQYSRSKDTNNLTLTEGSKARNYHGPTFYSGRVVSEHPEYQYITETSNPSNFSSSLSFKLFSGDAAIREEIFHFENHRYTALYRYPQSQYTEPRARAVVKSPTSWKPEGGAKKDQRRHVQAVFEDFASPGLPEAIKEGFSFLVTFYSNGHDGECIADCIFHLLPIIAMDFKKPAVELALITVTVLGCFIYLPELGNGDGSLEGAEKRRSIWMAVLFLKMMLFKYRWLLDVELAAKLGEYQGNQGINNMFLLNIHWVVFRGQPDIRPHPLPMMEDLILVHSKAIEQRLELYKRLIKNDNSSELLKQVFDSDGTLLNYL